MTMNIKETNEDLMLHMYIMFVKKKDKKGIDANQWAARALSRT